MTTFIGYSTVNQNKKFTLTDTDLVKQDLLNAFNIRMGQLPGVPGFGTNIHDFIFDPQDQSTTAGIYQEVQRVCAYDPRISVEDIQVFPWDNGFLLQLQITIVPANVTEMLNVLFNADTRSATYVTAG